MGKDTKRRCVIVIAIAMLSLNAKLSAQSPSDAIMMNENQACVLMDYSYGSFDHYYEGEKKRSNQTIATVSRKSFMPMMAVGLSNNLNIYVALPYIQTESSENNGGKLKGAECLQDLSIALKYKWLNFQKNHRQLLGFATIGFARPISSYLADYMPYSIGLGTTELTYRAIFQYQNQKDWYLRTAGTYHWRGYTKAERAYYYNNGSFYTPWMDVPSAFTGEVVLGKWLLHNSLQLETTYWASRSLSGDDIRSYAAPQPTNKVHIDRVGVFAHYFFPKAKGLGVVGSYNKVLSGRNAAIMSTTELSLTYFFDYKKN